MADKLSIEDIEQIARVELFRSDRKIEGEPYYWEGGQLHQRLACQLLETMRENERLRAVLTMHSQITKQETCLGLGFNPPPKPFFST